MQPDALKKPERGDVESAIMDAVNDVRVLDLVLNEVSETPCDHTGPRSVMVMDESVFLAWQRMSNLLMDSVRTAERLFHEAGR